MKSPSSLTYCRTPIISRQAFSITSAALNLAVFCFYYRRFEIISQLQKPTLLQTPAFYVYQILEVSKALSSLTNMPSDEKS